MLKISRKEIKNKLKNINMLLPLMVELKRAQRRASRMIKGLELLLQWDQPNKTLLQSGKEMTDQDMIEV